MTNDWETIEVQSIIDENARLKTENEEFKKALVELKEIGDYQEGRIKELNDENKRLIDKLNKTALELVDECISQGKATEISEMSYREFLDYRAENGKPMELQL